MVRLLLVALCACLLLPARAAEQAEPLRVGLLPTLPVRQLLTNTRPLQVYLERELKRPVQLLTATDFRTFHRDTMAGAFDIALTAPHFARLAQIEGGATPLATFNASNRAVLIMARGQPVTSPAQLRGGNLGAFDSIALIVLQAQQWLDDQGLVPDKDFTTTIYPSHTSVALAVARGESRLGVISPAGLRQLPPEVGEKIQVHAELPVMPAVIWIASARAGVDSNLVRNLLLRFEETAEGIEYFRISGYGGMRRISAAEMRALDLHVRQTRKLLKEPQPAR